MQTLIDPFELHAPGSESEPAPRVRPRLPSIAIEVEWEEPPPTNRSQHGVRIWSSED